MKLRYKYNDICDKLQIKWTKIKKEVEKRQWALLNITREEGCKLDRIMTSATDYILIK